MLPRLVSLLGSPTSNVAESAAVVLACCCTGAAEQSAVAAAGAVAPLVALLSSPQRTKQEAALEALAALSRGNAQTSQAMLQHRGVVGSLLRAIKQGGSPHTRFVAAVCLANLSRNLPAGHQEHNQQVRGAWGGAAGMHGSWRYYTWWVCGAGQFMLKAVLGCAPPPLFLLAGPAAGGAAGAGAAAGRGGGGRGCAWSSGAAGGRQCRAAAGSG